MARNSSLGIGEMMYRQLEQTVKETKTLSGALLRKLSLRLLRSVPANVEHPVPGQPEIPTYHHEKEATT